MSKIDEIYTDYSRRKQGMYNALCVEHTELLARADPEADLLCLYGNPDGSWSVQQPAQHVPTELPEPCVGINLCRGQLETGQWLAQVAAFSDAWLMSCAFYRAAVLTKTDRALLFKRINEQPCLLAMACRHHNITDLPQILTDAPAGGAYGLSDGGLGTSQDGYTPTRQSKPKSRPQGRHRSKSKKGLTFSHKMTNDDITDDLLARNIKVYWPDDGTWYEATVIEVSVAEHRVKLQYPTDEQEDLQLDDVIPEGHAYLAVEEEGE